MNNSSIRISGAPAGSTRLWASSVLVTACLCAFVAPGSADPIQFTSALDDGPLAVKPLPNEILTDAVRKFYETGEDPYKVDPAALAEGKKIYDQWCQSCHMPDGSGRIGPSFLDDTHHYPRFTTDKGMFEIVYGGATGAMQAFGNRLKKDQILRVMAYVRSLRKEGRGG